MLRNLARCEPAAVSRGRDRSHFLRSRRSASVCVAAAVAALLWLPAEAQAACTPAAASNVDATCTGTTDGLLFGYGTGGESNLTVTVVPGASVTALGIGIDLANGTVFNFGAISGINQAINANGAITVFNSGIIAAGNGGISALTNATITNSGSITSVFGNAILATTANVANSGTITGGDFGINATIANVTNSGIISGGVFGISATTANVTNSGTITGGNAGINGITFAVINSGTITGGDFGINGFTVGVTNSGTITGSDIGIVAVTANVTNSGTITGGNFGINAALLANVTNSGIISGGIAALQFGAGNPDSLTLLPGSTIIGAINLGGGGDTIDFRGGNHNLTFDTLAGATVTGTTPFVVVGNRAVAIDPTPFAMADRTLLDFSRAVSSAVPEIEGSFTATTAAAGAGSTLAFAGPDGDASTIADDVAAIPGVSAYADDANLPFKSSTVVYGNGTALWARAFVGERVQDEDGALLETHNRFYGGLLGGGWQVRPNLRLGLFLGAGETRSSVDFNYGETESTLVFAGLTGRYTWGASFLRFGLQGGHSSNDSTRNTNNNLVAGGIENATASFDGWYVTPEATFGHHYALGSVGGGAYTLTPSLTVRYLHASLDGHTETGTTAPLTIGDRSADSFEERGQLKLTRTQIFAPGEVLKTSLFGGVLADQRVGDDSVDAVLLGQAIPFAVPGDDSVWGGFAGAGLEWRTGRITLFASAEYLALSDSSSVVSGQGGVRVAF